MINQLDHIKALLKGKLAQQTGLIFLAQIIQAVIGFVINILLIRSLNFDEYSAFSIFSSSFMLLAGLSHWGWSDTFVRFGSQYKNKPEFSSLVYFFRKKIYGLAALTAGCFAIASPWLAQNIYRRNEWKLILLFAVGTGFLTCVYSFEMNRLRVLQQFKIYGISLIANSGIRVCALLILIWVGLLNLNFVLSVYFLTPIALIFALLVLSPPNTNTLSKSLYSLAQESSSYNRWLLASIISTTIIGNVDTHILAYFHDNMTVARLGASSRLTLPISLLVSAIGTTVLPRLSESTAKKDFVAFYLRKLWIAIPAIGVLVIFFGAAAIPAIHFLAGPKYAGLEPLFMLQLLSILIVLITNPLGLVFLAYGKTKILALLNIGQLIVDLILDLLLIPKYGAEGAVLATILINLMGLGFIIYLLRQLNKSDGVK